MTSSSETVDQVLWQLAVQMCNQGRNISMLEHSTEFVILSKLLALMLLCAVNWISFSSCTVWHLLIALWYLVTRGLVQFMAVLA
jgi:hypothetical protein